LERESRDPSGCGFYLPINGGVEKEKRTKALKALARFFYCDVALGFD
jgi:hypothetical protein